MGGLCPYVRVSPYRLLYGLCDHLSQELVRHNPAWDFAFVGRCLLLRPLLSVLLPDPFGHRLLCNYVTFSELI